MSSTFISRNTRVGRCATVVAAAAFVALSAPVAGSAATGTADATNRQHVSAAGGLTAFGITPNGRLVRFKAANADQSTVVGAVTGMSGDTRLLGIDFRVQDGKLYAVGNLGGVYTVNRHTAVATRVSQLTVALEGRHFGVDFNPAADRLRIVSNTGQNLRHDVNTGGVTTVDTVLSYTPPATATGITMAAYTNNDVSDQTGTSLFDVDTTLNQVALQAPANNGSLSPTGALGVDAAPAGGLDIYSELDDDGVTSSVVGLASIKPVGEPRAVFQVNLLSGRVTELSQQRATAPLVDLAVVLDQR